MVKILLANFKHSLIKSISTSFSTKYPGSQRKLFGKDALLMNHATVQVGIVRCYTGTFTTEMMLGRRCMTLAIDGKGNRSNGAEASNGKGK